MKTLLGATVFLMLACGFGFGFGCGGSGDDDDDDATGQPDANDQMGGDSWAPDGLVSVSVQLAEDSGPTNTWQFPAGMGTSGTAMLVGVDGFPFTYTKTGNNTSTLEFDVGGPDSYEMKWTSDTAGSFMESFDGQPGNPGTFTVSPL